jgi:hypothetical protein
MPSLPIVMKVSPHSHTHTPFVSSTRPMNNHHYSPSPTRSTTTFGLHNHELLCEISKQ